MEAVAFEEFVRAMDGRVERPSLAVRVEVEVGPLRRAAPDVAQRGRVPCGEGDHDPLRVRPVSLDSTLNSLDGMDVIWALSVAARLPTPL